MNSIQFFAILRQLLTFAGTYVVATGNLTGEQADTIIGAGVALASVAWSIYASRKDRMVAKVAALPEVDNVTLADSSKGRKLGEKVDLANVN